MLNKLTIFIKILIGISAGPGLMIFLPFVLSAQEYGLLFGYIAVIQLITVMSSAGLEIVAARVGLPIHITLFLLMFITIIITTLYSVLEIDHIQYLHSIMIIVVVLSNNMSLYIQNRWLFDSNTSRYAQFGVARAIFLVSILTACIYANVGIELGWTIASLASVVVPYLLLQQRPQAQHMLYGGAPSISIIIDTIYAALPMAALNAMASMPFITERLIAKASLDPSLFPKYAVGATLMTPMVYFGNMSQNYLISNFVKIDVSAALEGVKIILITCMLYLLAIFCIVAFFLPPYFENIYEFYATVAPCGIWVFVYCIFAFPLAAITQKHAPAALLMRGALTSGLSIMILFLAYKLLVRQGWVPNMPWKVALTSFIMSVILVIIRAIHMWPLTKLARE